MKIKVVDKPIAEVLEIPRPARRLPKKQSALARTLLKALSKKELKEVGFHLTERDMEGISETEPVLFLMNHSSFIDLKIASTIISPRPFHIVCTLDGFTGKEGLMRWIGCIPAKKFVNDITMIKDIKYAVEELGDSILMYPEASYSFDGTETPLPNSLGKMLKLLGIPVVMIKTSGAFARDPLYNGLQIRETEVTASMKVLFTKDAIKESSVDELNATLKDAFRLDYFEEQKASGRIIDEPFRADYLERVLYKCPHCKSESHMKGHGITLRCESCGAEYQLEENGALRGINVEAEFTHIPDWYHWERTEVKGEIERGEYFLSIPVDIKILADTKSLYSVGEGTLTHDLTGFTLTDSTGTLNYQQHTKASYSLYADYYWYELGDMISIGDARRQYYCFPKDPTVNVCKARLATEELYKLK